MVNLILFVLVTGAVAARDDSTFRAAVFEHAYQVVQGNATATKEANLRIYEEQAKAANLQVGKPKDNLHLSLSY